MERQKKAAPDKARAGRIEKKTVIAQETTAMADQGDSNPRKPPAKDSNQGRHQL
jgi:hypothetical protein